MASSDDESVSSGFSPADSPYEIFSENEQAYSEGTAEDVIPLASQLYEEPPSKRSVTDNTTQVTVPTLLDTASELVAAHHSFEMVERFHHHIQPVPLHLQLDIMKRAFPRDERLVETSVFLSRQYPSFSACCLDLACEADDDTLLIRDAVQIGFTATATIVHKPLYRSKKIRKAFVYIQCDRQRITSAICSVHRRRKPWCRHIVRVVFQRIRNPSRFAYHLPMSYSLEDLDLTQHKQLLLTMLSDQPLSFLSHARRVLDRVVAGDSALVSSDTIPDTTAGAGLGEDGTWHIDETRVRRVMTDHCASLGQMEKGCKCSQYETGASSLWEWSNKLATLPVRGTTIENDDIVDEFCSDLSVHFQVVRRLLRQGEELAVKVLQYLTDQWLNLLETLLDGKVATGSKVKVVRSTSSRNISLFTCTHGSCLPCRLMTYWRLAVINPFYSSELLTRIVKQHKRWAKRLDQVVTVCTIGEPKMTSSQNVNGNQRLGEIEVIRSLEGWNGFRHIQAWAAIVTQYAIGNLRNRGNWRGYLDVFTAEGAGTDVGSKLATAVCVVRSLKFYDFMSESLELAVQALQSVFSIDLSGVSVTCRSKRVKRKKPFSHVTSDLWGSGNMALCWPLTTLLEMICLDENAWKTFSNVSNMKVSFHPNKETPDEVALVPVPVCLYLHFATIKEESMEQFYATATQAVVANEMMESVVRRSELYENCAKYINEAGLFIFTNSPYVNFNFSRFSRFMLGLLSSDSRSFDVCHPLYKMLLTSVTEQAQALALLMDGEGSDDQFYYALTEYGALLLELLIISGENESAGYTFLRQALEPVEKFVLDYSARDADGLSVDEAVRYKRLCEYVTDLGDVSDLLCFIIKSPAKDRLFKRYELLRLGGSTCSEISVTRRHGTLKCGALLHLKLLSVSKVFVPRFVLQEIRNRQLSVLPQFLKATGTGDLADLLWSVGWESCLLHSELLHQLILTDSFVKEYQRLPSSVAPSRAICSLLIEAASAITCPAVSEDFFSVVMNLGTLIELHFPQTVASMSERRIPEWPHYVLFRMAKSLFATLQDRLSLAVAAYQRLWVYCRQGFDLFVLLTDQRMDYALVSDLHNLASLAASVDGSHSTPGYATEAVLRLLMDAWVDPFVTFNVLAEIARTYGLPEQFVGHHGLSESPKDGQEPVDCLKNLIEIQPQCSRILERCKRHFLALLTGDRVARDSMDVSANSEDIFRHVPMASDMICLDIILEICPDSGISIPEVLEMCKDFWLLQGAQIAEEYNRGKECDCPVYPGTTTLLRDTRYFYYRRILQEDLVKPWQLPVADVLRFSSSKVPKMQWQLPVADVLRFSSSKVPKIQ